MTESSHAHHKKSNDLYGRLDFLFCKEDSKEASELPAAVREPRRGPFGSAGPPRRRRGGRPSPLIPLEIVVSTRDRRSPAIGGAKRPSPLLSVCLPLNHGRENMV